MKKFLFNMTRFKKNILIFILDNSNIFLCLYLSFLLRLGEINSIEYLIFFNNYIFLIPLITILSTFLSKTYKIVLRSFGERNIISILIFSLFPTLMLIFLSFFTHDVIPRSTPIIFFFLLIFFSYCTRILIIFIFSYLGSSDNQKKKVAIYGAGITGLKLFKLFQNSNKYNVVNFIDDDEDLQSNLNENIKILSKNEFVNIYKKKRINEVWIAIPSLKNHEEYKIKKFLSTLNINIKITPGLNDLILGNKKDLSLKEIDPTDLFEKKKNIIYDKELNFYNGKSILVTGGGGSIGSEICRQLALLNIKELIILDLSEYNLFNIINQIKSLTSQKKINLKGILASVSDEELLNTKLKNENIDIIIHSAAYKHVDLVEDNYLSSYKNNFMGTFNLCKLAVKKKCQKFLLISTDKAVNPKNFMGFTKRLCEILILYFSRQNNPTKFSFVRFGNVIGSSGSAIPLFIKQIKEKKEIDITDKKMKRFFMSINEAVRLVLLSCKLSDGSFYMLDMGKQHNIYDVAKKLIFKLGYKYSKKRTNEKNTIKINFIGIRRGEKLEEELIDKKIERSQRTNFYKIKKIINKKKFTKKIFQLATEVKKIKNEKEMFISLKKNGFKF